MKIYLFLSIFLVNNTILFSSPNMTPCKSGVSRESMLVAKIREDIAETLFSTEKLLLIGTGGQMMNGIEMLNMGFEYTQEVDLNQARHLLVTSIRSCLDKINQSKEVRRYLKPYPFTAKNIEIDIFVRKPDGSDVPKDKLFFLSANDGMLTYYLRNPTGRNRLLFHKETYDEAEKIIASTEEKALANNE